MTVFLQAILIALVTLSLLAQSPPKRKKVKNFGSSLKRLKWNPQKNAAEMRSDKKNEILDEGDVVRIETSLVSSDLLVLDRRGNNVSGLTADDFVIAEDGVPQTVGHFFNGDNVNVPRTIVLIIDYSGSQLAYLYNSIQAAKVLVDKLGPRDLMAIATDDVDLLIDFTSDKKQLKDKLDTILDRVKDKQFVLHDDSAGFSRLGRSRQYSALMATLNEMFNVEDVRRIVIFQTDGDEAYFLRNPPVGIPGPLLHGEALAKAQRRLPFYMIDSAELEFSLDDLYRAVERERVTVYSVIPGVRLWGLSSEEQLEKIRVDKAVGTPGWMGHLSPRRRADVLEQVQKQNKKVDPNRAKSAAETIAKLQAVLASVGTVSGGWADFLEIPEQADAIYSRILSDINQRYIVGYYPTNKEPDGKRRKITFEVKGHPEYKVYGRVSYFAPGP